MILRVHIQIHIIQFMGYDSIVILLNLNTYSSIVDTHEICLGDSVVVANNVYYLAGSYLDTLNYVDGCDSSIINTPINLLPSGCTDPVAFNFDSLAQCDDNSCIMPIYGCLDSSAINYYAGANYDDGSCVYADVQILLQVILIQLLQLMMGHAFIHCV